MVFTWHSSATGNQSPQDGGLYIGTTGREREATRILDLLARPAGASDNWTYLIDPVLIGENELLTLASSAFFGQTVAFGPVDTVYQGVEIARIDLSTTPASVTSVVQAHDAVGWTLDQDAGLLYFHRRYYSAPPGSGPSGIVADTVFQVPLVGGTPVAIYGRPPLAPGLIEAGMSGFAVLNGRLFVSLFTVRPVPPPPELPVPPPETESFIVEVRNGQAVNFSYPLSSRTGNRWGRLTASADGEHLIAESRIAGSKDLQLLEVGT
jgi:hypothetical protein